MNVEIEWLDEFEASGCYTHLSPLVEYNCSHILVFSGCRMVILKMHVDTDSCPHLNEINLIGVWVILSKLIEITNKIFLVGNHSCEVSSALPATHYVLFS